METVLRVSVVYVVILIGLRLMGKREFAQLSPVELVSLMLIPQIVQQAMVGDDFSVTNALIGLTTLFILVFVTSLLLHRFESMKGVLSDRPALLVARGRLLKDALNRERVTPDDVLAEIRRSGLETLGQVKWAILESDGKISVVPEEGHQAVPTHSEHRVSA
jgi:uncharacterized membrane protein YcaP (DUF421 family)